MGDHQTITMKSNLSNLFPLESQRWIYVYAKLRPKEKRFLKRYYSTLYPRNYVQKLVAYLDKNHVQLKESQGNEEC